MSAGYLLDTNICVHFLRGEHQLQARFAALGLAQCFVSEITVAELLFGAANSAPVWQARQRQQVAEFQALFAEQVLPIGPALAIFAEQKAALRRTGRPIDDFDWEHSAGSRPYPRHAQHSALHQLFYSGAGELDRPAVACCTILS